MNESETNTRLTLLAKISKTSFGQAEADGLSQAWSDFAETYLPLIFRWCQQLGLGADQSQDASQEVMLKLLTLIKEFHYDPERGRFRSWLKTVTTNLVRDMQRSASTGDTGSGDTKVMHILSQIEDSSAGTKLSEIFERQYDKELLEMASLRIRNRVDPKNWEAWQLYAIEQQDAREVAKKLGIPVAEVYVAKSRIIKMMREEISQIEEAEIR